MIDINRRTLGANIDEKGKTLVKLWSPLADKAELIVNEEKKIALTKKEFGYWQIISDDIKAGDRYKFILNNENYFPDPASLSQPGGVHGPSEVIDLKDFKWTDEGWNNLSLHEYILYELHTGVFTLQGTFAGIEEKLDYLKDLGINAIEIMPVAQFPGDRNWGYDGVFPFAVQNSYGGARGLQQLVNTCHQKGFAVILDVVYNHLGPEGNYLGAYGPYFTEKYKTPWGGALNFDDAYCDGVREYFIENALMWFRDFHIDALRLDAVHAIKDFSPVHILREIKQHVNELMQQTGRTHYLIVELDLNDTRFINPLEKEGYGMDAQWIDEFHHALRLTAGGEQQGYYSDFTGIEHLAKAYKDAYVYDGQYSEHRKKNFGVKANNPGQQFIVFSQNHDQVGNRMLGERTSRLASFEMQKLLAGAVMVSPYVPMLFMGEEWSEPHPFLYFVSHTDPELAEAVRKGRKEEFAAFHIQGEAPDPLAEATFRQSKLQWELLQHEPHNAMHRYYKALIWLKKNNPVLSKPDRRQLHVNNSKDHQTLTLHRWQENEHVICMMNFSKKEQSAMLPSYAQQWHKILDSAAPEWSGPKAGEAILTAAKPGSDPLPLQPESIIIYRSNSF